MYTHTQKLKFNIKININRRVVVNIWQVGRRHRLSTLVRDLQNAPGGPLGKKKKRERCSFVSSLIIAQYQQRHCVITMITTYVPTRTYVPCINSKSLFTTVLRNFQCALQVHKQTDTPEATSFGQVMSIYEWYYFYYDNICTCPLYCAQRICRQRLFNCDD